MVSASSGKAILRMLNIRSCHLSGYLVFMYAMSFSMAYIWTLTLNIPAPYLSLSAPAMAVSSRLIPPVDSISVLPLTWPVFSCPAFGLEDAGGLV